MAYTEINFRTKKLFREAVAAGQDIRVFQPGPFGPHVKDGPVAIEGPHYPEPHRWYASVVVQDGKVVKVKS